MSAASLAEQIARNAQGRLDERARLDIGGRTYVDHFARVASRVDGDWTKAVAWLHDTVEDTPVTLAELRQCVGPLVADAVELMTHKPHEPYTQYVDRIWAQRHTVSGALAYRVKIADLCDNLDVRRSAADGTSEQTFQRLRAKHQPALDRLLHGRWLTEPLEVPAPSLDSVLP